MTTPSATEQLQPLPAAEPTAKADGTVMTAWTFWAALGPLFPTSTVKRALLPATPETEPGEISIRGSACTDPAGLSFVAELFTGEGSAVPGGAVTDAVFEIDPAAFESTVPVIAKVAAAPLARSTVVEMPFPEPEATAHEPAPATAQVHGDAEDLRGHGVDEGRTGDAVRPVVRQRHGVGDGRAGDVRVGRARTSRPRGRRWAASDSCPSRHCFREPDRPCRRVPRRLRCS